MSFEIKYVFLQCENFIMAYNMDFFDKILCNLTDDEYVVLKKVSVYGIIAFWMIFIITLFIIF